MSEASWSGLSSSGADGKQKIKVWSKGSENLQQVRLSFFDLDTDCDPDP
jgi:hypothetical protein